MTLYERLFPRWRPRPELRPKGDPGGAALRLRWLGTAAHVIETDSTTLLVDPYLTRRRLRDLVRRLVPDEDAIRARLPPRVDAVLLGHSHFDHLLDAPLIAKLTGAKIVGSRTTCAFARASGVPIERIVEIPATGGQVSVGDFVVRFFPSLHGRIFLGRVPLAGEVTAPPRLPAFAHSYKMGGAFGILAEARGVRVYHNGSADLVDAALADARCDVLLAGLAGRRATRDYLARLVRALRPRLVVPTHHDAFFGPLDDGVRLLPAIDLEGFVSEIHRLSPAAVVTPGYDEVLAVPEQDARAAVLAG